MYRSLAVLLFLQFLFFSCADQDKIRTASSSDLIITKVEIPSVEVKKAMLSYHPKKSIWMFNDKLFSGYAVSHFADGSIKEKIGLLNGKKQNETINWFNDGHYKRVSNYHKGKLHGENKSWSADDSHILISHHNYYLGKAHGQQNKWYPTGEKFMTLNMVMGKEEGLQQAFRKNGALYANYEAVNGRIFGLKKAALCFGLENEKMKNEI